MPAPQLGRGKRRGMGREVRAFDVQSGEHVIVRLAPYLLSGKRTNNPANRLLLFRVNPHCHWCGLKTRLAEPGTKALSHFHATVDHVYGERSENRDVIVLACHGCNQRRGTEAATHRRKPDPERRAATLSRLAELAE